MVAFSGGGLMHKPEGYSSHQLERIALVCPYPRRQTNAVTRVVINSMSYVDVAK